MQLQISATELFQFADRLKQQESEIVSIFEQVQSKMLQVENYWDSPASKSLLNQFQVLKPVFNSYVDVINRYYHFLIQTAQAYQENEEMILKALSNA